MKVTTRERILEYIRKNQTASVHELSHAYEMSGANIRHHLAILRSYGLIEVVSSRKQERGRPNQVYGIAKTVLEGGLEKLSKAILNTWLRGYKQEDKEKALAQVAEEIAGDAEYCQSLRQRLVHTTERLNILRYHARWEATATGPRIDLWNCPYGSIISDHPELCEMDAILLEKQLGYSVKQIAKQQLNDKGFSFCTFYILVDQKFQP